jgi:hypothetical protein
MKWITCFSRKDRQEILAQPGQLMRLRKPQADPACDRILPAQRGQPDADRIDKAVGEDHQPQVEPAPDKDYRQHSADDAGAQHLLVMPLLTQPFLTKSDPIRD